jgi:hypothetical protein
MNAMKHTLLRSLATGFTLLLGAAVSLDARAEVWVAPTGDDEAAGTEAAPLATLESALRQAREWRRLGDPSIEGGIHIVLADGVHRLTQPLLVRVEDSGTAESPTVFRAAPGARPVISGGVPVEGWAPLGEEGAQALFPRLETAWMAELPWVGGRPLEIRDLWIGDRRAERASNWDEETPHRILEWDRETRSCWIPAAAVADLTRTERGIATRGLEMVIHQMWAIAILRVRAIEVVGERARVSFHEPEGRVQWEHPWPPVVISEKGGNSAFFLANRHELLDAPGEWHAPSAGGGLVLYVPLPGESPGRVLAVAPVLETLVRVEGTREHPVGHIHFEGIQFSHTAWKRPGEQGHVPLQAGFAMIEAYKLRPPGVPDKATLENQAWVVRPPAAVELRHVRQTRFHRCVFAHLGAGGLDYVVGAEGDVVEGNVFRDIGGNGFVAGSFQEGPLETHVPYDPDDARDLVVDLVFRNNLVTGVGATDWGSVGVAAGYVRGIEIAHNEIHRVSYTGISLGWGWTRTVTVPRDNRVHGNNIHDFGRRMYDTGGVYTLSPQPGTFIERNAIHSIARPSYVHDPYHWSFIYLDEGSSFITVRDNWTSQIKFSTNSNGPGNVWTGNGPDADPAVRLAAGLEAAYRDLLSQE